MRELFNTYNLIRTYNICVSTLWSIKHFYHITDAYSEIGILGLIKFNIIPLHSYEIH